MIKFCCLSINIVSKCENDRYIYVYILGVVWFFWFVEVELSEIMMKKYVYLIFC